MNNPTLSELLHQIVSGGRPLAPDHPLGRRLVCPEYTSTAEEVKTFPLPDTERLFVVCWDFSPDGMLYTSMYPSPEVFHYCYQLREGEKTQLHTHDFIELAYIAQGNFSQHINGRDFTFHAGEFVLIDKNCLHQDYLRENPATVLFFGIANDIFSEIMDETVTEQRIIAFLQSALLKQKDVQQFLVFRPANRKSAETESLLQLLVSELYRNEIGSVHICKGLLLRLFRLLSTQYDFSLTREQRQTMSTLIYEEVLAYIRVNYAHMCIADLTEHFHFQEDYFNRLIKSRTGMTYSEYLQKVRIEKAGYFLLHTDLSIDAIAEKIGYHNKGYFYKIFSETHGMTPAKYRKTRKN